MNASFASGERSSAQLFGLLFERRVDLRHQRAPEELFGDLERAELLDRIAGIQRLKLPGR